MAEMPVISDIVFKPVRKDGSLIGFVSFDYDGKVKVVGAGVHVLLNDKLSYRVVYPREMKDGNSVISMNPTKREVSKHIDMVITEFINKQW